MMNTLIPARTRDFGSAAKALPLALSIVAGNVLAESGYVLEEIIITAQKRAESLQDVPLAIQTVSGEEIAAAGVSTLANIEMVSPSVIMSNQGANVQTYIRGVGSAINGNGIYNSVAIYLDDVYLPRPIAGVFNLANVESVQVLKGPQGALYGRNATAGALIVTTSTPAGGEELSGTVRVTLGSDNLRAVSGTVSGSFSDTVGASLSVLTSDQDGYIDDRGGPDLGGEDAKMLNVKLAWDATEKFSTELSLTYREQVDTSGQGWQSVDEAGSLAFLTGLTARSMCAAQLGVGALPIDGMAGCLMSPSVLGAAAGVAMTQAEVSFPHATSPQVGYVNSFQNNVLDDNIAGNRDGAFYASEDVGATVRLSYEFDTFELVSVTGYTQHDANGVAPLFPMEWRDGGVAFGGLDIGGLAPLGVPLGVIYHAGGQFGAGAWYDNDSISQELRLVSTDSDIDWIVGVEYFREQGDSRLSTDLFGISQQLQDNTFTQTAMAIYGQATFPLTDSLSYTLGARYTDEENELEDHRPGDLFDPNVPYNTSTLGFEQVTWTSTLDWNINDVLYYASIRTGFKSGGQNVNNAADKGVDPEELTSYELGFKSELLDGRVRLNGASFYYDFENVHISTTDPRAGLTSYIDGASSEVFGAEMELTALLTEALTLNAAVVWMDAEFTSDANPRTAVPLSIKGNSVPGAADAAISVGLGYALPLPTGEITANASAKYSSGHFFDPENLTGSGGNDDEAYTLFNLSMGYLDNAGWSVRAFVNNAFDEEYYNNGIVLNSLHRLSMAAPGREVGVTFGYDF
jgi:outer membrane receptor protein involved in Fe transport